MEKQFTWRGEKARKLMLCRPCSCGCDTRDGIKGVGYLTGSLETGDGITVWIEKEDVYRRLQSLLYPNNKGVV
jgi:hypothetical protein